MNSNFLPRGSTPLQSGQNNNFSMISNLNKNSKSQSKTIINESNTRRHKVTIKYGKKTNSGSLLKSSRSSKYNKVMKNGKKIRNIDINASEDEQSEDIDSLISFNKNKNTIMPNKLGSTAIGSRTQINNKESSLKSNSQIKKSGNKISGNDKSDIDTESHPLDTDEISNPLGNNSSLII